MSHHLLFVAIVAGIAAALAPEFVDTEAALDSLTQHVTSAPDSEADRERCEQEAETWAGWCQEAEQYLQACDDQLRAIDQYCGLVDDGLAHCQRHHGVDSPLCGSYHAQEEDCAVQRDDMVSQQRDARRQRERSCHRAEQLRDRCEGRGGLF